MTHDAPVDPPTTDQDPVAAAHQRARDALTRVEEMSVRLRAPGGADPLAAAHAQARAAIAQVEATSARLREALTRVDNRDRTVRITMTPSGEITELYLDPDCMRMSPEDLSREVVGVYHAAMQRAQQMADAAFGEQTGLSPEISAKARRGEIDVRGMFESIGLGSVLKSVEKLGGGPLI